MQLANTDDVGASAQLLNTLTEEEKLLAQRYLRPAKSKALVFEFTRDAGHLHQYYILREKAEVSIRGLQAPQFREDEVDRHSHILIARRGNQVIAGGRLTISSPRRPMLLPLEQEGTRLAQEFLELNLENHKYAEVSRVVIESEFQNDESLPTLLQHLYRKILATRVEYIFGLVSASAVSNYRKFAMAAGLELKVRENVAESDGVRLSLVMLPVILNAEVSVEEAKQREAVSIW